MQGSGHLRYVKAPRADAQKVMGLEDDLLVVKMVVFHCFPLMFVGL